MPLNGSHIALGNVANGNFGSIYLQVPGESGSSQQGDEMAEKGKRTKNEAGRGSRGSGTFSRKRTRAVQGDSLPTSEAMPDGSLSGGTTVSAGRAVTVNGTHQIQNPNSGLLVGPTFLSPFISSNVVPQTRTSVGAVVLRFSS